MKNIIKDNNAIMNPIISCILSLAVIVIMYFMFMPLQSFISATLISIGAPAAQTLLFEKYERWGFILFAVGALLILISKVYKQTHDTGYQQVYGR